MKREKMIEDVSNQKKEEVKFFIFVLLDVELWRNDEEDKLSPARVRRVRRKKEEAKKKCKDEMKLKNYRKKWKEEKSLG